MPAFTDHYRTLGVHRHAEQAVIEAAYRALARRYHPDLNPGDRAATKRLQQINAAYAELSGPDRRRAYDATWDAHHSPPPPKPPRPTPTGNDTKSPPRQSPPRGQPRPAPPPPPPLRNEGRPWLLPFIGAVVLILLVRAGSVEDPGPVVIAWPTTMPPQTPIVAQVTVRPAPTPAPRDITPLSGARTDAMSTIISGHLGEPDPELEDRGESGSLITVCDPAYPEPRTCIPMGPPFDQGCAITAERNFTALPPDPQGLDHDGDGIGCEPVPKQPPTPVPDVIYNPKA